MSRRNGRTALALCLPIALAAGLAGCAADHTPILPVTIQFATVGAQPRDIQPDFAPQTLLVSCWKDNTVDIVDLSQMAVSQRLAVRQGPAELIPDRAQKCTYCLHLGENAISILGGNPPQVQHSLGTGSLSLASGTLRPDHNELWIADGVSAIYIVTPKRMQLKDKINVGRYPQAVAFSRNGQYAFVTLKGENAMIMLDVAARQEVGRVETGIYPREIVIVGNTACISNSGSHNVSLVDIAALKERARVNVRKNPNSLSARGNTLWVSCEGSYRLVAIDVARAAIIGTVKAGFYPGVVRALDDGSLAVADPKRNQIAIITPTAPEAQ